MKAKPEAEACELFRLKAATTRRAINGELEKCFTTRFQRLNKRHTRFRWILVAETVQRVSWNLKRRKTTRLLCSLSVTHISGLRCVWWVATIVSVPSGNLPCYRATIVPEWNPNPLLKNLHHSDTVRFPKTRQETDGKLSSSSHGQNQKKVIFPATATADGSLGRSSVDWQDCSSRSSRGTQVPPTLGP